MADAREWLRHGQPAIYARHRPSPALQSALLLLYNGHPAHSYSVLLLISIYNPPFYHANYTANHTKKKVQQIPQRKEQARTAISQRHCPTKEIYIYKQSTSPYSTLPSPPSPPSPLRPTKPTSPSLPPSEIPPSQYSAPPPPTTPTT